MIKTFKNCFYYSFAEGANLFIYYISRLPLIGKKVPQSLYKKTDIKLVFGIIGLILSFFRGFINKGLYIALIIWLPSVGISKYLLNSNVEVKQVFLQLFFILSFIIGSFFRSVIFSYDEISYKMIKLIRVNPKDYYFNQIIYKIITQFIYFLPALLVAQIGFVNSIMLLIELAAFRLLGEWTRLISYKKSKSTKWNGNIICLFVFLLLPIILSLSLNLFIQINISSILFNFIFLAIVVFLAVLAFINLFRYKQYTLLSRIVLSADIINQKAQLKKDMVAADVKLDEKKIGYDNLNSAKFDNKKGYDYLNSIFFSRHIKLVIRPIKIIVAIIIVVFIAALFTSLFVFPDKKIEIIKIIKSSSPVWVFILYMISSTQRLCKAMFYNCDIAMLRYGFYKGRKGVLDNFESRLKKMISFNLIPAFTIVVLLPIFIAAIGGASELISIIPILISIITLALFFSIYSLFLYYILQPYSTELGVKSPFFQFSNFALYIICFNITKVKTSSIYFTLGVIAITVLFVPISLFLVYKYAPKTFKLK